MPEEKTVTETNLILYKIEIQHSGKKLQNIAKYKQTSN